MTTNRAILNLRTREYRPRRDDYPVTVLVVTLFLGFLVGLFVGAMIVNKQERYEEPIPREEMFHEQPGHSERSPELAVTQNA